MLSDGLISTGLIMMNERFSFFEELGVQKGIYVHVVHQLCILVPIYVFGFSNSNCGALHCCLGVWVSSFSIQNEVWWIPLQVGNCILQ